MPFGVGTKRQPRQDPLPPSATVTAAERETIIRWDEEDKTVIVWSASRPVLRKMLRLGFKPRKQSTAKDGRLHGMEFAIPGDRFRWGLKRQRNKKKEG